jgi:hypothetical protein
LLQARAKRYPGRLTHGGGGAGEVIGSAIAVAAQGALAVGGAPAHLQQCIVEVAADLSQQIDDLLQCQQSPESRFWVRVLWARWIAVALVYVGFAIFGGTFGAAKGPLIGLGFAAAVGSVPAVALFFQVHCLGLLCMPARFFQRDPRGKKALARSGVSSVLLMKFICVINVLLLLLPQLLFAACLFEMHHEAPK